MTWEHGGTEYVLVFGTLKKPISPGAGISYGGVRSEKWGDPANETDCWIKFSYSEDGKTITGNSEKFKLTVE